MSYQYIVYVKFIHIHSRMQLIRYKIIIKILFNYNDSLTQFINIIEMKPILSALGVFAAGSLMYLVNNYISNNETIVQKQVLRSLLILLRKRFFSTLRQIAFVVNNIRANEADFQPKKISDIIMKNGGSGDAKLNLIQQITLKSYEITRQTFQASCNFYKGNDYQIRVLLKNLSNDIQLALNGTIQSYNGPTNYISSQKVILTYRQILKRRMQNIKQKLINQATNQQCIKRQFQIEEYLQLQGIKHEKQANQKIFISILQKHYRENIDFRIQFQHLQIQMTQFMQEIEQEQIKKHQEKQQKQQQPTNQTELDQSF